MAAFVEPIIDNEFYEAPTVEWECAQLHILDLSFPILIGGLAALLLPRIIIISWKIIVATGLFIVNTFMVLYTMIITIDKQTIKINT